MTDADAPASAHRPRWRRFSPSMGWRAFWSEIVIVVLGVAIALAANPEIATTRSALTTRAARWVTTQVGRHGRTVADVARDLGMAPWQVDKARRSLAGWDGAALGRAIQAVALADAEVKGGGRDPVYAVERAVLTITAEHGA